MIDHQHLTREITEALMRSLGQAGRLCAECVDRGVCKMAEKAVLDAIVGAGATRIHAGCSLGRVRSDLARYIDHTLLKSDATRSDIEKLCREAITYGFFSVCINPCYVPFCRQLLAGSDVKVCTVIGFPLGCNVPEVKAEEARIAVADGAHEVDMVVNVGALKSGEHAYVEEDIASVVRAAGAGVVVKVILETALLTDQEKVVACEIARRCGADFVKTSTGFSTGGATEADIALMRKVVGPEMGIKASGGVRDTAAAERMVRFGATRIGASASVEIVGPCEKGRVKKSGTDGY